MRTECNVCMHHCSLEEGKTGICRARKNEGGTIRSTNYGKITSIDLDPMEKKPLLHFYPGTWILSVGSFGCNLRCPFCQNYSISQSGEEESDYIRISPEELVEKAVEWKERGNVGIAFTYNEPLIGWEFVRDTARLSREKDLKTVVVTNGSFTEETLQEVLPYVDAMNIDLKGFTDRYYRMLGGDLETVKKFILGAAGKCHIELTTLIVPGENDTVEEMQQIAAWIAAIDPEIPLHISRFFPAWKMQDRGPTRIDKVMELVAEAQKYLKYVHPGNC